MNVIIAGGSGFLGQALAHALLRAGHDVTILTRSARGSATSPFPHLQWQPDGHSGPWARELDGADAVVNLAGAGLADKRWTAARKVELKESRVLSTRSLVTAMREAARRPPVFVQASGTGYYGTSHGSQELDESYSPGSDFLAELCVAWEAEARPIEALGVRLVTLRQGVVLGREGGAIKKMRLPFLFFGGGPIASGQQYLSWVHIDDWTALVLWAVASTSVSGVFNATAPTPVTNEEFSRAFGRALHRPSWLRMPGFALRALVGEMAQPALIEGQRVIPKRALALGFTFASPSVDSALGKVAGRGH